MGNAWKRVDQRKHVWKVSNQSVESEKENNWSLGQPVPSSTRGAGPQIWPGSSALGTGEPGFCLDPGTSPLGNDGPVCFQVAPKNQQLGSVLSSRHGRDGQEELLFSNLGYAVSSGDMQSSAYTVWAGAGVCGEVTAAGWEEGTAG